MENMHSDVKVKKVEVIATKPRITIKASYK